MEAKVIKRFYGAEDGQFYPRWFEVGDEIKGDLAVSAIQAGNAKAKKKRRAPRPKYVKNDSGS
jgi:hypothetical protein